jgi:two-component system sensor histidine kinase EvgS
VLTDLNMPVMDGFELVRAIRRHEAATGRSRTPIVALSANVVPGEAEKCVAAGMDDFAGKPTSMPVLVDKLRRWLPHIGWEHVSTASVAEAPAAIGAVPPSDEVVDPAALDELTGGDADLAAAILADYVDSSGPDLVALRGALAVASADDVRRGAHRIKGASQTVGAHHVATLAAQLEAAASMDDHNWLVLQSIVDDLETALGRVAAVATSATAR